MIAQMFKKLSLSFGVQVLAKWQGMDMQEVYQDWADAMQDISLGAINHGIKLSKQQPYPPNQGEFIAYCQTYKPSMPLMIESKLTPEQIEENRKRIAGIAAMLAKGKAA